jgi:hypothetical protein
MAGQSVLELPYGDDWLYEIKLDGYRALLMKDGERLCHNDAEGPLSVGCGQFFRTGAEFNTQRG